MNESEFIGALRSLPIHDAARGLGDDCAILSIGSETLVITHDAMAQGIHWLPEQDLADVAWKLLAANLSDLAAKGARPEGVLLSYQLAGGDADPRFLDGLDAALRAFEVPLLGGDTIAATGPQTISLTAIGLASHVPVPSRSGARPGDSVFVAGTIGDAYAGFELLKKARANSGSLSDAHDYLRRRFTRPSPMLADGERLAPIVSAMMDVSDGLLLDAARLADASGVTLAIDSDAVPFSSQFREWSADRSDRERAMRWGDDYALLFTAAPADPIAARFARIGKVMPRGENALLIDGVSPGPDEPLGYTHG